ncbi:hypothetical protein ACWHAM_11520 [Paenibacillus terrae]
MSLSPGNYENFKAYAITAANSNLATTAWSAPVELAGIGSNYIDTFIVKIGSTYHAFTKNETTKYIEYAIAPSLTGPYTFQGTGDWANWGSWVEGPAPYVISGMAYTDSIGFDSNAIYKLIK